MNIEKEIKRILALPISAYQLSKESGVAESTLSRLKSGEREVKKMSVETAQKILDYSKKDK